VIDAVRARPALVTLVVMLLVSALLAPGVTAQDLDAVTRNREDIEVRLETLSRQLEDIEARRANVEDAITDLDGERAALAEEAARVDEQLQRRLREQFKHGGPTVLAALLSGDGVTDSLERAGLLNALGRRDRTVIERSRALTLQMAQSAALIQAKQADLAGIQAEMQALSAQLQSELAAVSRLEKDLRSRKERQMIMERGAQNGTYACIVARPYHYVDSWGSPRSGGRRHKGTDVMAQMGAEVYAITHGRITSMKSGGLGGIVLYLWGDDGVTYYYAHLRGYASTVHVGKRVEAGELIAFNGNTGNARGSSPHIHFEVHPGGGSAVNPYPWLRPLC